MSGVESNIGNTDPENDDSPDKDIPKVTSSIEAARGTVSYAGEIVVPQAVERPDPKFDPIANGL